MKTVLKIFLLLIFLSGYQQATTAQSSPKITLPQLQKRYNSVRAWGNGYIVEANNFFAFINRDGIMTLPFEYTSMKPLLHDRMEVSSPKSYDLVNEDGVIVYHFSENPIQLKDSLKRKFYTYSYSTRIIFDDSGRQLKRIDTNNLEKKMTRIYVYKNNKIYFGLEDMDGDTILPLDFNAVAIGKTLYGGIRNDTLYVGQLGKGLLFKSQSFHSVKILRNDMIFVGKWGAWALMGRDGKLLTKFDYGNIQELQYPYSINPQNSSRNNQLPDVFQGFALFGHQPKGLLDENGVEILPAEFDDIYMNTNGWFIVRKVIASKASLLDSNLTPILERGAFAMRFINNRYVKIINYGNDSASYFDMKLRKITSKTTPEIPEKEKPYVVNPLRMPEIPSNKKDTFYLNNGLTTLHKKDGFWGVTSITGDTLVPFINDTASRDKNNSFYFVGKQGRFKILNQEGQLLNMPELTVLPQEIITDSVRFLNIGTSNNLKLPKLGIQNTRTKNIDHNNYYRQTSPFIILKEKNGSQPAGIYNRNFKLLSKGREYQDKNISPNAGFLAISDSIGEKIAVIDTNGKIVIPFINKPKMIVLREKGVIILNDTGRSDILYSFSLKGNKAFTIRIPDKKKYAWIYGYRTSSSHGGYSRQEQVPVDETILFGGDIEGYFNPNGTAVFVKGFSNVYSKSKDLGIAKQTFGGSIIIEKNTGKKYMPELYDSIQSADDHYVYLFKKGKMGLYNFTTKKILPPIYDELGSVRSLENRFLNVKVNDISYFINEDGRPIKPAWNVPWLSYKSQMSYQGIKGIPAEHQGKKYKLYVTAGDTLIAIPDSDLPEEIIPGEKYMDGTLQGRKGALVGVFRLSKKDWIIPPLYKKINKESDYFFALSDSETTVFNNDGVLAFKLKGSYPNPKPVYNKTHWYMGDWHPAVPVVSNNGKIIVPDTFKYAVLMELKAPNYYEARTYNDKYSIFDTNGKQMLPAIFDGFSDSWMFDGYLTAYKDDKIALISPQMKQLTLAIYKDIFMASRGPALNHDGEIETDHLFGEDKNQFYFLCAREEDKGFGILDKNGQELIPTIYDSIRQIYNHSIVIAKKKGKWGLINLKNKTIAPFIYDSIGKFNGDEAKFIRGDKYGILRKNGKEFIK